jgi:hypothetical protein
MSKYDALGAHLRRLNLGEVPMTFAEVEQILGFRLPKSHKQAAWWNGPSGSAITRPLLKAGYRADKVDVAGGRLVFKRIPADASGRGLFDLSRAFAPAKGVP